MAMVLVEQGLDCGWTCLALCSRCQGSLDVVTHVWGFHTCSHVLTFSKSFFFVHQLAQFLSDGNFIKLALAWTVE